MKYPSKLNSPLIIVYGLGFVIFKRLNKNPIRIAIKKIKAVIGCGKAEDKNNANSLALY